MEELLINSGLFGIKKCPECNGVNLTWYSGKRNSGVVDGRLRMHEIGVVISN